MAWWGIVAIDILEKKLREVRPYEVHKGSTEKVYWENLHKVCDAIRKKEFPAPAMKQAHKAFSEIAVDRSVKRPVIGVVGEIYVRCNRFSNDNLVKTLEDLGAEVKVPPVAEWIFYTNHTSKKRTGAGATTETSSARPLTTFSSTVTRINSWTPSEASTSLAPRTS